MEAFTPSFKETSSLRIYVLKGKQTTLIWLRDKINNWESELEKGVAPQIVHDIKINLPDLGLTSSSKKIAIYDPWKNLWTSMAANASTITLPDFKRSVVIKISSR
jgi:hypothetical protein